MIIKPQEGKQEQFLSTCADIAIYGGAAGGGKTFSLLLEPIRHVTVPSFGGIIFRRTYPQITNEGGLWPCAQALYPFVGAKMTERPYDANFKHGNKISFRHIQHEKNKYDYQGSQIPFIGFDELTHFSQSMFFYLLSRNRSTCGIKPYVRCTCNPDPDSWVKDFIGWWLDPDTGYPIEERSGKIRYMTRDGETLIWGDTKEELYDYVKLSDDDIEIGISKDELIKSVTFISSNIYDNKILLRKDPGYLANLKSLPSIEREQLLAGNWNIKRAPGLYFKREWFGMVEQSPRYFEKSVRYWDRASTRLSDANKDPDWTVGLRMIEGHDGYKYIADIVRFRGTPLEVENKIYAVGEQDGIECEIALEQDPGQAGQADIDNLTRKLSKFNVRSYRAEKTKENRALPVSAHAEGGFVKVVRAGWNNEFFNEIESFPNHAFHDDQVDALSGAYNTFEDGESFVGSINVY